MGVEGVSQRPVTQARAPRSSSGAGQVSQHTLLQKGSRGPEVADLQKRLNQAGFQAGQSGGIKNGQSIGAIGDHSDHVHAAF